MQRRIKNRYPIAEIEIKNNRLILITRFKRGIIEQDATALWDFFKDLQKYLEKPTPLAENSGERKTK